MNSYHIFIGSINGPYWGKRDAINQMEAVKAVKEQIENLDPLNSSPEGREAYRNRFRGQEIIAIDKLPD